MDLISAKVEAAAKSRKDGKAIYIYVDNEGEALLDTKPHGQDTLHVFKNGSEIALDLATMEEKAGKPEPVVRQNKRSKKVAKQLNEDAAEPAKETKSSANKTTKKMATVTKKTAKKAAKKTAKKATKKTAAKVDASRGPLKTMKIKDIVKALKAGKRVFNEGGKPLRLVKMEERANQDKERQVSVEG